MGAAFDDTKSAENGENGCVVLYETGVEGGFCVILQQNCSCVAADNRRARKKADDVSTCSRSAHIW
jgi:hypothetical protein